jgi:hypothetical protein
MTLTTRTALTCSEAAPLEATSEGTSGDNGTFAPKVYIQSISLKETFEEVRFDAHILSSGLLFLSRHPGYKVGQFVDVAFAGMLAGEMKGPNQRAEIIHVLEMSRGDLAIGLRFWRGAPDAVTASL